MGIKYLEETKEEEIAYIQKDYKETNAVVVSIKTYKGHIVRYKYIVNEKVYENSDGFQFGTDIRKGDTIRIRYSISNPSLSISEFNDFW